MSAAVRPASSGKGVAVHNGVKLPFEVVFASSADDGFDARQLEAPSKAAAAPADPSQPQPQTHIKGWQSAKYCPYPQTLVLRFPGYFDIRKIQILSHQSKIANTIELYAGVSPALGDADDAAAAYQRLGYLSLDSNERSGFKARELKSVYVNARGNFLKLTIRKCHANQLNQYGQVGIIAINVVGVKAAESAPTDPHAHGGGGGAASGSSHDSQRGAALSSLMSQYGCDEKTAHKMLELDALKARAIAAEDYDEAKRLKIHLDTLRDLSGKIAALERRKVEAVAREDYDAAKEIKREIDFLRGNAGAAQQHPSGRQQAAQQQMSRVSSQKSVGHRHAVDEYAAHQAYEQHHPPPQQQQRYQLPAAQQHHGHAHPHADPYDDDGHGDHSHEHAHEHDPHAHAHAHAHPPAHHHAPPPVMDEAHGLGSGAPPPQQHEDDMAGDDRPIRPSRNAAAMGGPEDDGQPISRQPTYQANNGGYDQAEDEYGDQSSTSMPPPEQLSAVNRKDAEPLLDVFGEHAVLSLYSRHWMLRQSALKDMTQAIADNSSEVPLRDLFAAACRVLKKGLSDKVSQIFLSACQLLSVLLNSLAMRLRPEDVRTLLDPLVGAMMDKLSSSNVRERDGGMQVLTFLALDSHVHPSLVPSNLLQPLKKKEKDSPLPLKCRAKILLKCVIFYGLDDAFSLSLGALTRFVQPHLLHRDAGVRDGMFNLIAAMSSLSAGGGGRILAQLKDVRPQTLETLQAKVDDVASGAMHFLKPVQPSLDVPYVSDQDPTHTLHGVPAAGQAGVSIPPPAAAAAAPAAAAPTPAKQRQGAQAQQGSGGRGQQQQQGGKSGNSPAKNAPAPQQQQQQQQHHQQQHHPVDGSIAEEDDLSADLSGKCQFCGLEDPSFSEGGEDKLDLHYWSECPILISCKQCEQVIEIPTLTEHLLHECEVHGAYKECSRCRQAVLASAFAAHAERRDCHPPAPGMATCALCHAEVHQSDEGWKQHLLVDQCPKNTRIVK